MSQVLDDLTPKEIVSILDNYIIGQEAAKKAVAIALRNRYRRRQLTAAERDEIIPKNILMIGPTGVGKTEIARRLAQLSRSPFIKVEATKFTEVGYVGRDVESIVRDLAAASYRLVQQERIEEVREDAQKAAEEEIIDRITDVVYREQPGFSGEQSYVTSQNPLIAKATAAFGWEALGEEYQDALTEDDEEPEEKPKQAKIRSRSAIREEVAKDLKKKKYEDFVIEITVEVSQNPFVQLWTPQGMEEMGLDSNQPFGPFGGSRGVSRSVPVSEAREILTETKAQEMLDETVIKRDAIERAEQNGIVFLDELDKIAIKSGEGSGPAVSREGVQRDLLPIIEGSTVATKYGNVKTDYVLFVCAGAFHESKPSDLIPELQGRLPIRVELESLNSDDFRRILAEPKNALTTQYAQLLKAEGVSLTFDSAALDEIAKLAQRVNEQAQNIGARRLHTLIEKLLEDVMFEAPDIKTKKVKVTKKMVQDKLSELVDDQDLSRYIL